MAQATRTEPAAIAPPMTAAPPPWRMANKPAFARPSLDAATGIAVGVIFGIGAWCLFALAVIGTYR